jgi:oxygen-independent coproporphyrinogen-3 oxidase
LFRQPEEVVRDTLDAICTELTSSSNLLGGFKYRAIYVGGGTPSSIPLGLIEQLFATIDALGDREPGCEVSFEVHPENASPSLMKTLQDIGVTRISMGVESLDDSILARENRRHTTAEALAAHEMAKATGFQTVNLDFIYGMENQQALDWLRTLEQVHNLRPDSITAYQLRMRTHSAALNRFRQRSDRYASAEETLLMHLLSQQIFVRESSYHEAPIDWYVRNDQPAHTYQTYNWRDSDEVPLLGFGPSAYSYVEGCQYYNSNDLGEYVKAARGANLPVFRGEVLEEDELWRRSCVLGLKIGLDLGFISKTYGTSARDAALEAAAEPIKLGLMQESTDSLQLTATGTLLADEVARCFYSSSVKLRMSEVEPTIISTTSRKLNG